MILRLKGADFSGNNIGTLSTWQIYKNLKGFTTESAISSVEKDASYSATFYVKDGYTFSTASVTMGGTDITSSLVWNSTHTEATLTIAKVTGNVQINITGVIAGGTYYTVNYTYSQLGTADAIQNGTTRTVPAGTVITESDFPVLDEYYYQRMIIMPGQEVVESVTVNSNINIQWEYAKKLLQGGNVYTSKALNADGSLVENSLYDTFYDLVDVESNTTYTILKGYDSNTESYVSVDECVAIIYERIQDLNSAESSTFKQLTLDENNCFTTSSHSYDSYEHTICVVVYTGKEIPLIVKGQATLNNLDKEESEGEIVWLDLPVTSYALGVTSTGTGRVSDTTTRFSTANPDTPNGILIPAGKTMYLKGLTSGTFPLRFDYCYGTKNVVNPAVGSTTAIEGLVGTASNYVSSNYFPCNIEGADTYSVANSFGADYYFWFGFAGLNKTELIQAELSTYTIQYYIA